MNNFPDRYKFWEMAEILKTEYKDRLFIEYRGGDRNKPQQDVLPLSREIAEDFGIAERTAQRLIKITKESIPKKKEFPELNKEAFQRLKSLYSDWKKFDKEEKSFISKAKTINEKKKKLEKEAKFYGGFERLEKK